MTIKIPFKQGDTFILENTVTVNDIAQDITDWVIKSKAKLPSANFVDELVVTKTDPTNGVYQIKKQDTTAWPSGLNTPKTLLCDIEYQLPSTQIISTETFEISCITGIT